MLTQKVSNIKNDTSSIQYVSVNLIDDIQKWITDSVLRKFSMLEREILQQNRPEIQQIIIVLVQGLAADEWRLGKSEEETKTPNEKVLTEHPSKFLANNMSDLRFYDRLMQLKLWLFKVITGIKTDHALFNDMSLTDTQENIWNEIDLWVDETIKEPLFAAIKNYLSCERLVSHGWIMNTTNKIEHNENPEQKQFTDESPIYQQQTVTVKFVSKNSTVFTKAYKLYTSILEIKQDLYSSFNVFHDRIVLTKDSEAIPDLFSLAELGAESYGTVEIELHCDHQIDFRRLYEDIPIPDVITVTIKQDGTDETKDIVVEIINQSIRKPYLGGYRNRISGIEYQHAFSQTKAKRTYPYAEERFQRATQTYKQRHILQNTLNDAAIQVTYMECYIPETTDRVLPTRSYETYDECIKQKNLEAKVRVIQKYWRQYKVRLGITEQKKMFQQYWKMQNAQIIQKAPEEEQHLQQLVQKAYPHTKADFEMLYSMLDRWHKAEIMRISTLKCEGPRRAEFMSLLEREVQLLLCIEKYRIEARKEKLEKTDSKFLAKCARPITWISNKGTTVSMETIGVQRARELQELYLILCQEQLPRDKRLDVIITLKYTLRAFSNSLTEELNALLDREYVLLSRGMKSKDISSLHQRTKKLFSQLIKDPDFNPEAAKHNTSYQLVKREAKLYVCNLCSRLLPHSSFKNYTKGKNLKVCIYCTFMQNISWSRTDMRPYEYIILQLREDERKRQCFASIAFLMQDEDYYHLISNIWHNKSAISKHSNLFNLRLCRWDINHNWSPWNCILLTENEMKIHVNITNVHQIYEQEFIAQVMQKHAVAKGQFQNLRKLATSHSE